MRIRVFFMFALAVILVLFSCKKGGETAAAQGGGDEMRHEGAIAGFDAKVIDKEAREKGKGLLKIAKVVDGDVEIASDLKIEVWKPGADPEEHKAETSRWGAGEFELTPGNWDLRIVNDEGPMSRGEGWIRNVPVVAGKMWKADVVRFHHPMQYLRVQTTLGGQDVSSETKTSVFKAGVDVEEIPPLQSFWGNSRTAIRQGVYDLVLLRNVAGVKSQKVIRNFEMGADRQVKKVTFALDSNAPAEPVPDAAPGPDAAPDTSAPATQT